jgi:MFS family permease
MVEATDKGQLAIFLAAGLFGFLTFPIYSIAAAHAHDFASQDERVELSAALLFYYALGAIASPLAASALIEVAGPSSLFAMVALGHTVLVVFGLARLRVDRPRREATRYVYAPRTSFLIGRLLRGAREGGRQGKTTKLPSSNEDKP